MAENDKDRSSEDLSEEVSQFRLEDYRKRGMVSQSKEITGLLALLAVGVVTYVYTPSIGLQIGEFMREVFRVDLSSRLELGSGDVLHGFMMKTLHLGIFLGLPITLAGFFFGILGSFAQIGAVFSLDPLTPDFSKIDPLQGLQKFLTFRQVIEGFRLVLKMAAIVGVSYGLVKAEIFNSPAYLTSEPVSIIAGYGHAAKVIFMALIGVLIVFAALDFAYQRFEFMKNLRMTKEEAKQEHKEREGDPQIKARIRTIQRDMARKRMMQAVKKADVLITNPTHFAIAIVYDKEKMFAPKVVAKGADFIAQRMKKIAADAGVPLVENVPLARTLYKSVKVGQFVPKALYQAVAEVLAYVYRLKRKDF
ncbi:EscU/YscU/HrcU family type III secretion system export apparatus switch protein [Bdellovibrionota bacterium FG-2]